MAPRTLGKAIGVNRPWTLRALGLRELASGVGILSRPRRSAWLWSRVAGDAMDLALLGSAFRAPAPHRVRLAATVGTVSLVTALDVACSRRMSQSALQGAGPVQLDSSIVIDRPAEELYRFWRELTNLPRFMRYLREVRVLDSERSHWVSAGPVGSSLEWDALITEDLPGELIAWRSAPDSPLHTSGSVRFERAPDGEGSIVRLQLRYQPPPGAIGAAGAAVARLLAAISKQQLKGELRRFKQLIETGEVATTEGQSSGRRSATVKAFNRVVQP
ncbi:MAG TPA: SRPBCC family protein [Steroidobacteraceae bacterium]|nr:SRPBCC family protein [Steroidobacteraceae bacterium]